MPKPKEGPIDYQKIVKKMEPAEIMEEYTQQEKDRAEGRPIEPFKNAGLETKKAAEQESYELKDLDAKTLAAIDFLQKFPAWKQTFGGQLTATGKITTKSLELVQGWMKDPTNRYDAKEGKWISEKQQAAAEKSERVKSWKAEESVERQQKIDEFKNKFDVTIEAWEKQGYKIDREKIYNDYLANPDLDLVTTKDMKILWGTRAAGYEKTF